mmetsp:Transcript_55276/g.165655  ORF Transcript_55276/g.165655 Transcript_55276/m.165655 type:complete len:88 (+) Transcript_55276:3076-3339(+)
MQVLCLKSMQFHVTICDEDSAIENTTKLVHSQNNLDDISQHCTSPFDHFVSRAVEFSPQPQTHDKKCERRKMAVEWKKCCVLEIIPD